MRASRDIVLDTAGGAAMAAMASPAAHQTEVIQENAMSEEYVAERSMSGVFVAMVGVGLLTALVALGWCYALQSHLTATEQKLAAADQKNAALAERLEGLNARLRATSETLGQSVGI